MTLSSGRSARKKKTSEAGCTRPKALRALHEACPTHNRPLLAVKILKAHSQATRFLTVNRKIEKAKRVFFRCDHKCASPNLLHTSLEPNDGGSTSCMLVIGYTEGMSKEDLLAERQASAKNEGRSVQAPRSRAGWGNRHIRRKAMVRHGCLDVHPLNMILNASYHPFCMQSKHKSPCSSHQVTPPPVYSIVKRASGMPGS